MSFLGDWAPVLGAGAGAMLGGPAGAAVGLGLGSMFSEREGAKEANAQNQQMSQEQMAFQERMSSTAHQREVEDLKKAGLNPILSANAGSSTPAGSMATAQNPNAGDGEAANVMMQYAQFQMAAAKQAEEIKLIQAQRSNVNMDTTVKAKGIPESEAKNAAWNWVKSMWDSAKKSQAHPQPTIPAGKSWNPYTNKFEMKGTP